MGIFDFDIDPLKNTTEIQKTWSAGIKLGRKLNAGQTVKALEEQGYDKITLAAVRKAILEGEPFDHILEVHDERKRQEEEKKAFLKKPPPIHGSADWSAKDELEEAGLLSDQKEVKGAIFLGQEPSSEKFIQWNEESHLLTIAPTRTGKGTMQIIPNLLRYQGSTIVLDPKGELAAHTLRYRASIGEVFVINPFGQGGSPHHINPIDGIRTEDDAKKLANLLYPRDPKEQGFFGNEATELLAAVLYYVAKRAPKEYRNIGAVRDLLSGTNKGFWELIKRMKAPANPPFIRNAAEAITTKDKDKALPRLFDSLGQHLNIWDAQALRKTTAKSDLKFEDLKNKIVTVYLVFPFTAIEPYSTFIQSILGMALDAMINNPTVPEIPVLFCLDEFLMLKPMERFVSALRTHASAGMRLWFFLQDLATLKERYPTMWESFLQAEVISFFGTNDLPTAQFITQNLGKKTDTALIPNSASVSLGGGSTSYGSNEQMVVVERDLMTPQEVMRFMRLQIPKDSRTAVVLLRGGYVVQAKIFGWGRDPVARPRCPLEWRRS